MRFAFILASLSLLPAWISGQNTPATATQPLSLTLDQCIEIAMTENPTIHVADMEITRVDYSKKETLGQLFPSVAFGGTYSRMLAKQVMYLNMGSASAAQTTTQRPSDDLTDAEGGENLEESAAATSASSSGSSAGNGIKMGLDNSFSVGFSASMPLIAPQLWKTLRLADSQILQTIEQARTSRKSLVNQVKNAYYTLLLANDSRRVIGQSYDMAKFTADIYEKQFSVGTASEYDVLRTQVAVKNVEPELLQADIAIKQAKLQLLVLMGIDATTPIEAADSLSRYQSTMYETALNINRDISDNPDLRQLDIQTRMLNDALAIQKASWYPTLALSANYNWTSMSNGSPFKNFRWNPYSTIGLTLSFPLFQGGQRLYAIKQAEIQSGEMTWQRENLERSVNVQVDLAIDNIHKNIRQIASSSDNVAQAEKAHDIMARSFEIGAASYLDLRDAELALTRTRLTYYESIYNYLVACSSLEYLLGTANVEPYMPAVKK